MCAFTQKKTSALTTVSASLTRRRRRRRRIPSYWSIFLIKFFLHYVCLCAFVRNFLQGKNQRAVTTRKLDDLTVMLAKKTSTKDTLGWSQHGCYWGVWAVVEVFGCCYWVYLGVLLGLFGCWISTYVWVFTNRANNGGGSSIFLVNGSTSRAGLTSEDAVWEHVSRERTGWRVS